MMGNPDVHGIEIDLNNVAAVLVGGVWFEASRAGCSDDEPHVFIGPALFGDTSGEENPTWRGTPYSHAWSVALTIHNMENGRVTFPLSAIQGIRERR